MALIVSVFFLTLYVVVTMIFWRNVKLSQPWKGIFSFTLFPLFLVAMVFNVWLTDHYVPGWNFKGGNGALLGRFPIAALICMAWYGLLRGLDTLTNRVRNPPQ